MASWIHFFHPSSFILLTFSSCLFRESVFLEAAVGFVGDGAFDEGVLQQVFDGAFKCAGS